MIDPTRSATGSASGPRGPMQGIKVLDLSSAATGPYACAQLADHGAEVIKVERPGIGDIGRWVGVQINGISALHQMCNRGKRSLAVAIDTDDGRSIVRRLAAQSDVVVQNWRPGVAERLGIGYDDLVRDEVRRSDLVYVSISGFGDEGPYASKGAYDTVIQAYAASAPARPTENRVSLRHPPGARRQGDLALTVSQAITAALFARERGLASTSSSRCSTRWCRSWIDAAGTRCCATATVQPGSFAGMRPFRFTDG
jgi:crotonobetainyl-CoA:carnitine CoA-transferase CaiB-like acyl-CoA transferase